MLFFRIRLLLLVAAFSVTALARSGVAQDHDSANWRATYRELLRDYVRPDGVLYTKWEANQADVSKLINVTDAMGKVDPSTLAPRDRLAFYINAYNAWTLRLILEHKGIHSVKDIAPGFEAFSRKSIVIDGKPTSLNYLENDLIFNSFADPRVHFAINCGSKSCPALASHPYDGSDLDHQLDKRVRDFLNRPAGEKVDPAEKRLLLSQIFDWYLDDFQDDGGIAGFLSKYGKKAAAKGYHIDFQHYDWSLNEAPEDESGKTALAADKGPGHQPAVKASSKSK